MARTETLNSRNCDKFVVRLPDGLRDRLTAQAEANFRSANQEYVMGLTWWLDQQEKQEALLQGIEVELGRLRRLKPNQNHMYALDALLRDYPDTASLVKLLQVKLEDAVKASR